MRTKDQDNFRLRELIAISQAKQLHFNVFWLLVPTVLDLVSSTLQFAAFSFVIGSVYEMFKGAIIISTLLVSKFYLKKIFSRREVMGSLSVFVGITVVAAATLLDS